MIGDNPMLVPPVATGSIDRDDESVGMSTNGRVLSDRSRGRESKQTNQMAAAAGQDFKKAYLKVSHCRRI